MLDRPFFSIIIPTYNSEKTLSYTLESIENQLFSEKDREIVVIDGGSNDQTINIARRHGCKIYYNKQILPEYGKLIGVEVASGKYIIRMDSDEEFVANDQLSNKKNFFLDHPDIPVLISNAYIGGRKELVGISSDYMNILGDPFSYFVYRTKKDKYSTYKKQIQFQSGDNCIMYFGLNDFLPLADSATSAYSLDYIKQTYSENWNTIEFTCSTFRRIISDTGLCGLIKSDIVRHNCSSDFKTYLHKLRFRVINNIYNKHESGFMSFNNKYTKLRTAEFAVYAIIIPLPILDSIRLSVKYRNITFILHFIYVYYICIYVLKVYLLRLRGKSIKNVTYTKAV